LMQVDPCAVRVYPFFSLSPMACQAKLAVCNDWLLDPYQYNGNVQLLM
jgi:hypothetical protein